MRRPRFKKIKGFYYFPDWHGDNVNGELFCSDVRVIRRYAHWLLKAADYLEWKRKQKS